MMKMTILDLLFSILLSNLLLGQCYYFHHHHYQPRMGRFVFDAPVVFTPSCVGSVKIEYKDEEPLIYTDSVHKTRIRYQNITASGCGCFTVHSGRHGGGSRRFIFPPQTLDRRDIGFPRIRSIYRIQCSAFYNI